MRPPNLAHPLLLKGSTSGVMPAVSIAALKLFKLRKVLMERDLKKNVGIQLLLEKYRELFRIPENLNHYSETDYRNAERKFLKYSVMERKGLMKL